MKAWRDIGGGKIKCDNTGEVAKLVHIRPRTAHRTIALTPEEWKKLEALAEQRSGKHKYTPEECVHDMIKAAHVGPPTWVHP